MPILGELAHLPHDLDGLLKIPLGIDFGHEADLMTEDVHGSLNAI